jgi:hypothetical protein
VTREEQRAVEHDCARLVAHYANLNDRGDWPALAELFVADGRLARPTAPDDWIVGKDAILAAFEARPPRRTRHLCTNVVIEVRNEREAIGECAIALYLSETVVKVGTFRDRFVCTPAGWRFAERGGSLTF